MKRFKTLKWVCRSCGWTWEVLSVIIDDTTSEKCLLCDSYNTSTIIQAPSIEFNGTGFHNIDYS